MQANVSILWKSTLYRLHTVFISTYLLFNVWFNHALDPNVSSVNVFLYSLLALLVIYVLFAVYYLLTLPKVWMLGVLLLIACYFVIGKYAHLMLYEFMPNHGHEAFNRISRSIGEFLFMNVPRFYYYSCISLFFVFQYRNGKNIVRAAESEKEQAQAKEQAVRAELATVAAEKKELEAAKRAEEMELRAWGAYNNPHFLQNVLRGMAKDVTEADTAVKREMLGQRLNRIADIAGYNAENVFHDRRIVVFSREWKQLNNYLDSLDIGSEGYRPPMVELVGEPMGHKIVPMTLVYLVEGAFTHGDLFSEPLVIRMELGEYSLDILFRNRIPESPRQLDTLGSGLSIVRRRLELAMWGKFTMEEGPKGAYFEVHIIIDQTP